MSRLRKITLAISSGALVAALAGCAPGTSTPTGATELVFSAAVTPNLTAEFWQSQIDLFEAAHPDVTVRFLPSAAGEVEKDLQNQVAAGTFPDVVLGVTSLTFKDFLEPFDLSDPDIAKVGGVDDSLIDGELYHLGAIASVTNLVFYNKSIFEQAGITSEPQTWAEFEAVIAKLKAAEITPLLAAGEWVTGYNWVNLANIFAENSCWYGDRAAGTAKFTDPVWVEAADRFTKLVDDGAFNDGALGLTYAQVEEEFLAGNGAMYVMGNWFAGAANAQPPAFDIGVFTVPSDTDPGSISGAFGSDGYSISNESAHPDAALQFAKFMVFNPEALTAYLDADGLLSNVNTPLDRELSPLGQKIQEIVENAPSKASSFTGSGACPTAPGTWDELQRTAQKLFLDPNGDHAALLGELDAYWDSNFR